MNDQLESRKESEGWFFLLLQVSRRQRDFVGYQRQNGAKLYVKPEKDALHHVGPSHSQDASWICLVNTELSWNFFSAARPRRSAVRTRSARTSWPCQRHTTRLIEKTRATFVNSIVSTVVCCGSPISRWISAYVIPFPTYGFTIILPRSTWSHQKHEEATTKRRIRLKKYGRYSTSLIIIALITDHPRFHADLGNPTNHNIFACTAKTETPVLL